MPSNFKFSLREYVSWASDLLAPSLLRLFIKTFPDPLSVGSDIDPDFLLISTHYDKQVLIGFTIYLQHCKSNNTFNYLLGYEAAHHHYQYKFFLTFVKDTLPLACNRSNNELKVSSQIIKFPISMCD